MSTDPGSLRVSGRRYRPIEIRPSRSIDIGPLQAAAPSMPG